MQLQKTPGKKRILVLGDSYIWGFGTNQENIFSAPEVHRTNDEIINGGVSGYGADQEYLFYLRTGQKFDVDQVVLALTLYNDVENNLASVQYTRQKGGDGGSAIVPAGPSFYFRRPRLVREICHRHRRGARFAELLFSTVSPAWTKIRL